MCMLSPGQLCVQCNALAERETATMTVLMFCSGSGCHQLSRPIKSRGRGFQGKALEGRALQGRAGAGWPGPASSLDLELLVGLQLLLGFPGCAVDALQLSLGLIAPPVGPCTRPQSVYQ